MTFTGEVEISLDGEDYFFNTKEDKNITVCISRDFKDWKLFNDRYDYVEEEYYEPTEAEYSEAVRIVKEAVYANNNEDWASDM
jgi:hypothetical protein